MIGVDVLIIGAGQAAASCAARLRAEGFDGSIAVLGAEEAPPYQRPALSKAYLTGAIGRERLFLRPEAFYPDNGIDLRTGCRVTGIDPAARRVILADGGSLTWSRALVLATGSVPRRLPAAIGGDLAGVHVLRDLVDADGLSPALEAGRRVLVVGGGYVGLEAAAVCAKRGLAVTLIEATPRILQRVAAPETADYFRALHHGQGVDLREGVGLARLVGDAGRVVGAELTDGTTLPVDLVIAGIGITPDTALAEAAGVALDNGIAVDAECRTSIPGIWAAGDCASCLFEGQRIRLESVGNAVDMGEAVARNILGAGLAYGPKPWFWSDQFDVKLQIAGLNIGYDALHVRAGDRGARSHWYYRKGRLIAVDAMNDPRGYMTGKRLIESGVSPDAALLADPTTDLRALMRA